MEQFHRNNPGAIPNTHSPQSSWSSINSAGNRHSYAETHVSTDTTPTIHSRTSSLAAPSYMSASIPRRKPAPIVTSTSPTTGRPKTPSTEALGHTYAVRSTPARASRGLLLLVIEANPAPNTIQHLRVLFKRHAFSGITIVGHENYETELKQLRIELYSLMGRMSMELGVQTYLRTSWTATDVSEVMAEAVGKLDERIRAVLCVPGTEAVGGSGSGDILSLNEEEIALTWRQSFGFIHTVARATFSALLQDGNTMQITSGFFVTQTIDQGAATMVMRSACGLLLRQLSEAYRLKGLAVGYAEENLIPPPEPRPEPVHGHANGNGILKASSRAASTERQRTDTPSESPTKLWGMWAMQEQLGNVS